MVTALCQDRAHGRVVHLIQDALAAPVPLYQPVHPQDVQVVRNRGTGQLHRLRDLTDTGFRSKQPKHDPDARWVTQRLEQLR